MELCFLLYDRFPAGFGQKYAEVHVCVRVCKTHEIEQIKQAEVVRRQRQRQRLQKEAEKLTNKNYVGQAERNTSVQERKRTQKRATHMDWRDKRESERESQLGPQKCLYTHTRLETKTRRCRHAVTPRVASLSLPQRCFGICLSLSPSLSFNRVIQRAY